MDGFVPSDQLEHRQPKPSSAAPLFSIICVCNRPEVLERFLLPGLSAQILEYQLRLVDNRAGQFKSAAAALNAGAADACGKYFLFVHQDVALLDKDFLSKVAHWLDQLPNVGAAGVAGARDAREAAGQPLLNTVLTGQPPGHPTDSGIAPLTQPSQAQTLDELLLIIPADQFRRQQFDEASCSGWHLYGVDYCLSALRRSKSIYVLPMTVCHGSKGALDPSYFRTLRRLIRKHGAHFSAISTTCGTWSMRVPVLVQRVRHQTPHWFKAPILNFLIRLGLWRKARVPPSA